MFNAKNTCATKANPITPRIHIHYNDYNMMLFHYGTLYCS